MFLSLPFSGSCSQSLSFPSSCHPWRVFIRSPPSQHAAHILRRGRRLCACSSIKIVYSRFNVHVFSQFPVVARSNSSRSRRIVSYLILSAERIMSFLYAFYSTSSHFCLLLVHGCFESHRLPSFMMIKALRTKYYSIEGWWQLCEINDGIIRLLQQWDNIGCDGKEGTGMKWVFVGFPLRLREDEK